MSLFADVGRALRDGAQIRLCPDGVLRCSDEVAARKVAPHRERLTRAFRGTAEPPAWPEGRPYPGSSLESWVVVLAVSAAIEGARGNRSAAELARRLEEIDGAARKGRGDYLAMVRGDWLGGLLDRYLAEYRDRARELTGSELVREARRVLEVLG